MENKLSKELKDSILKTGTTILGIVCKDGVVMAADRQMTSGQHMVGNKNFKKIYKINDYALASVAGQVSDAQRALKIIPAELKIKHLRSKSRPTIKQAANLTSSIVFSNVRQPSMIPSIVALFFGGFNEDGTIEIYNISLDGSIVQVEDYECDGSGSTFVLGLLERQYKKGISVEQGIELAKEALKSSTQRDVYSGYGIDIYTITKEGIKKVVSQEITPEYKDE